MEKLTIKDKKWLDNLDFSQLMDLRIDYAFKLLFATEIKLLISLLNAMFASAGIARTVVSPTLTNPYLEKKSQDDKLSILDMNAKLTDGTIVLAENQLPTPYNKNPDILR